MTASAGHHRGWWSALVLVPVALAAWVYLPIRGIWFFSDDLMYLMEIESDPLPIFLLRPFGGHNNLVRNLVFLASYEAFGLRASLYYWTVLLTHLLNVALLFGVLRALSGSVWLACFAAAAWGTSPLAAGALAWYSVYGQILVGTVLLAVLRWVLHYERGGGPVPARSAAAWYALLLAGTTCFGVGVGAAVAFPAVLFLVFPAVLRQRGVRLAFAVLPVVTLALYFGFRRLYPLLAPLSLEEAFQEALAREGLSFAPAMLFHLLGYSLSGVMLSFFMPPKYPAPLTTAALATFAVMAGVFLWRADGRARRAALAMAIVAVAMYGLVAVGRAYIYSAFKTPPETAAATPRYHYAASLPVTILLALVLQQAARLGPLRAVPRPLVLALALGLGAWGHARAGSPVKELRQACHDYFLRTMVGIAKQVQAAPPGGTVYLENGETPRYVLGPGLPLESLPGRAAVFLIANHGDALDGRRVRFIERDARILSSYRSRPGNRLGQLLVEPGEVPAGEERQKS